MSRYMEKGVTKAMFLHSHVSGLVWRQNKREREKYNNHILTANVRTMQTFSRNSLSSCRTRAYNLQLYFAKIVLILREKRLLKAVITLFACVNKDWFSWTL